MSVEDATNPQAAPGTRGSAPEQAPSPDVYQAIVENTPDALIFADCQGAIRVWNRGAEAVFGFSAAEVLGQSLDVIIPERLRAAHWAAFDQIDDHPRGAAEGADEKQRVRGIVGMDDVDALSDSEPATDHEARGREIQILRDVPDENSDPVDQSTESGALLLRQLLEDRESWNTVNGHAVHHLMALFTFAAQGDHAHVQPGGGERKRFVADASVPRELVLDEHQDPTS